MTASRKSASGDESLPRGLPDGGDVRALAAEACWAAAQTVAVHHNAPAVHRARQGLKRARALLRLLEDAGVAEALTLRRQLAAKARELAPMRDAHVVARSARRFAKKLGLTRARVLREVAAVKPARAEEAWWQEWSAEVGTIAQAVAALEVAACSVVTVIIAMRKSARRVRRRARDAKEQSTPEQVHDWRKAVVVLREQVGAARSETDETCQRLHRLSNRLGKATDAAVLVTAVESRTTTPADAPIIQKIRQERADAAKRARRTWKKIPKGERRLE